MDLNDNSSDLDPLIVVTTNGNERSNNNNNGNGSSLSPLSLLTSAVSSTNHRGIVRNKRELRMSQKEKRGRIRFGIFTMSIFFFIFFFFVLGSWSDQRPQILVNIPPSDENLPGPKVPPGYLVWSPGCEMPALDPLARDVMKLFTAEKYEECSSIKPLTRIKKNFTTNSAYLILDEKLKKSYLYKNNWLHCCYQEIVRSGVNKTADEKFNLTACIDFTKSFELDAHIEFILVRCKSGTKATYTNAHAIIRDRPDIRQRLTTFVEKNEKRPLSVLMLSIDSISRLNLIRAMPLTAQHLYDTGWFELQGYNKIDDNTFPNLMAILVGYNSTLAYSVCEPRKPGKLEQCPFVWQYYRNAGYVTAYGEDEASISTFNYLKTGFLNPPTDFYLRPYMLAAEKNLNKKKRHSLTLCLGYKHSADHIYDYALDFATTYKNDPYFGLFWTNTFSHNDISDPSSMDPKIKNYILELENREILNTSMVVFFSDHGLRFGPVRHLVTGWLEERLPFIFIWLPQWFKDENPKIVEALKINRNRLTNPYDLHMTLKHILELSTGSGGSGGGGGGGGDGQDDSSDGINAIPSDGSGDDISEIDNTATVSGKVEEIITNNKLPPALSCPNCQSLFYEMPWNRSCDDSAIASHWCTCSPYKSNDRNDPIVKSAVKFVINHINMELMNYTTSVPGSGSAADGGRKLCAELSVKQISYARKAEYHDNGNPYDVYMFLFEASPSNGWFEATVRYELKVKEFQITGSVSRLNTYGSQSGCMKVDYLKKYCFCLKSSKKG